MRYIFLIFQFSSIYVLRFFRNTKIVQRAIRSFLACRRARIHALSKIWDLCEAQYIMVCVPLYFNTTLFYFPYLVSKYELCLPCMQKCPYSSTYVAVLRVIYDRKLFNDLKSITNHTYIQKSKRP